MSKKRVHEIAKEFGVESKQVISILQQNNIMRLVRKEKVIFLTIIFFTPNGSMILNRRRKKMELYPMWLLTTGTFALTI